MYVMLFAGNSCIILKVIVHLTSVVVHLLVDGGGDRGGPKNFKEISAFSLTIFCPLEMSELLNQEVSYFRFFSYLLVRITFYSFAEQSRIGAFRRNLISEISFSEIMAWVFLPRLQWYLDYFYCKHRKSFCFQQLSRFFWN